MSLAIVDATTAEQICLDAQPHGYLLCRWRPEKNATGVVTVSNTGTSAVSALLTAHQ
ncbi:MAG: hypothetical protein R3F58_05350 [Steroidobacteraceae bacterium]